MSDIFERIADLSPEKRALLTLQLREKGASPRQPNKIARQSRSGPANLSFGQQQLWLIDQFRPGQPFYNLQSVVRLTGPLDTAILERSLNEIISRHDILRTTFTVIGEEVVQSVSATLSLKLPVQDLQGLPKAEQDARLRQLAAEEAQQPFSLPQGPLLRVALLRLGKEEHVFLLTWHHIVSDHWSEGIFMRELATLYEAFAAGAPSPLPALPIQYADFAHWQLQWMQGETLETSLAYWKQQLDSMPTFLNLPIDRPRPAIQSPRGAIQLLRLPEALIHALKALSQQEDATLFMTTLAAFKVLLYRYTGQEDVVVGTPIAGRAQSETEDLIGFFINTLVLRTDLSGNPSFRELLRRVRKVALEAYAHPDLPFEKLVEELAPERSPSYTPLFQVMFSFQSTPPLDLAFANLKMSLMEVDPGTARFDLSLILDVEGRHAAILTYNTDIFDAITIERLLGHFQMLLESIVANPEQKLSDLNLLTGSERHQVLVEWNSTEKEYGLGRCLHQCFEAQARRTPGAVAVVSEQGELTYQELDRRANQLANFLQALEVGPDVLVGICMERSPEMVVGILGVLKAGGAYLPLDPEYPQERLAFIVKDAQSPVVLTQSPAVPGLLQDGTRVVCLDLDWKDIERESDQPPTCKATAKNLAYAIYTSGSTGQPKGVLIPHQGIINRLLWQQDVLHITGSDRVLQKTPLVFDVSVGEIFLPLLNGARLVMARPRGHLDSAYLAQVIAEQKITVVHFVPSMLTIFLEEAGLEACKTSLRCVWCGGEVLSFELKERFFARLDAELYNGYGPTEASIGVTACACKRGGDKRIVPIGRPIANTRIYLLDQHQNPAPIGVPGELYVGGAGLAKGYLNRPDLTEKSFVLNPFRELSNDRLYRTGDLARYWPDGNIEFLGRLDYQIKIRGFRVELEEIEFVLEQYPAVRQAAVLEWKSDGDLGSPLEPGQRSHGRDLRLAAYLTAEPGHTLTSNELRDFLKERVPDYMIPADFFILETLPLTPVGKIDRNALLAVGGAALKSGIPQSAPRTDLEQAVADIWRDVLSIDEVGIHDNFFDLGGHSLLLLLLRGELLDKTGKDVSIAELFEHPTISALVEHLGREQVQAPSFEETQDRAAMQREAARRQAQLGQQRERENA